MKPILFLLGAAAIMLLAKCKNHGPENNEKVIANGQMPDIVTDDLNNVHLVYGSGDSILYSYSSDQGKTFSAPFLIFLLPKLVASHSRGPQITATSKGLIVTACNSLGDIFSFTKDQSGKWLQASKINDVDTIAKEGFVALAADGQSAFAVWLDLRRNGHNKIFGATSNDGGKTWSKNIMIYASPDGSVCECCKPSVAVRGNDVYVMFRNWLNGNRDLYLVRSSDSGKTFGQVQKLGNSSWALDGCPMDGGSLVIDKNGYPQTIWKRQNKIYSCEPGKQEKEIGTGRSCTMESLNDKHVYAWVEKGDIVVLTPEGPKVNLGRGSAPLIRAINDQNVICVWENKKQIYSSIIKL